MTDKLGGTKFLYAIFVITLAFIALMTGKIIGTDFTSFAELIGGLYVIGNVASKFAPTNIG